MDTLTRQTRQMLLRLHRSEQGAEGLEKLLIIGAIVLPLLGLLLLFRDRITELLTGNWEEVAGDTNDFVDDDDLAEP